MSDTKVKAEVTISYDEYADLKADAFFLRCLEDAGVDNWSGYDYARELYQEGE